MKHVAVILVVLTLFSFQLPSYADQTSTPSKASDESQLIEHGSYVNKDGRVVHSPAHSITGKPPEGATAKCRDGTFSFSRHHSGTCSHHGGVASWLS